MKVTADIFLAVLMISFFVATVSGITGRLYRKSLFLKVERVGTYAAFVSLSIYIVVRWALTGHPPVQYNFENAVLCAWFLTGLHILLTGHYKLVEKVLPFISGFCLLLIGWGIMQSGTAFEPLQPPFKSIWLFFHVIFAWLAFGAFSISAFVGGYQLLKRIDEKEADVTLVRLVFMGFIFQGLMIASGSIWAYHLVGSYWSWDPVETWSLIGWLIYGLYLHMRFVLGWRGRKLAWLTIISFVTMIITFFGTGFFSQYHTIML